MNTALEMPVKPVRVVNFAKILIRYQSAPEASLVLSRRPTETLELSPRNQGKRMQLQKWHPRPTAAAKLTNLETHTMEIPTATGFMSRMAGITNLESTGVANLKLPFGMPRFVNAATLKRMLNANSSETLLKRNGESWDVCHDSTRVDLMDESVEFRLGAVQILS